MNSSMLKKRGLILIIALFFLVAIIPQSSIGISYKTKKETNQQNLAINLLGAPSLEWEKQYGGDERDYGQDLIELVGEGYIIVGNYNAGSADENVISQGWILKVDLEGNTIWDKKYGDQDNWFNTIEKTSDGFIVAGTVYYDDIGEHKMYLVKINQQGNVVWEKNYGYENSDEYQADLKVFDDGSMILLGKTFKGSDLTNPLLIKVDSNGNEEWRKIIDRNLDDNTEDPYLKSIALSSDSGFVCAGYIQQKDNSNYDFWLIKFDENGDKQWEKLFDTGGKIDRCYTVSSTTDSGFILAGEYYYEKGGSPCTGAWVIKTDPDGNLIWDGKYAGYYSTAGAHYIEQLADTSYILTGYTNEGYNDPFDDLWIIKLSSDGEKLWNLRFGENNLFEYGNFITQTSDNGYITVGSKEIDTGDDFMDQDLWLLKLLPEEIEFKPQKPSGRASGKPDTEYTYETSVVHPDGLKVQFHWSFEGNSQVDVISDGWYESGEVCTQAYTWQEQGFYTIKVKAVDEEGLESAWSDPLPVSMPKNKKISFNVLLKDLLSNFFNKPLFELIFSV